MACFELVARQFYCFSCLAFYIHLSLQNQNTFEFPLITLLFSRLPASVRGKRSKGKVREIWAQNLLSFPFKRLLFNKRPSAKLSLYL